MCTSWLQCLIFMPGSIREYQNGLVERRIKEIGRIARCGKEMSGVPDLASSYCVLHSVDILNALPTKANPTDGTTDVTGFSPYLKYYGSQPSMDSFYVFGSYCSVHMDDDHVDKANKMSRLRHVYIFVMQVTSKVRDTWCRTTSAIEN